jgi:hypothetical protein
MKVKPQVVFATALLCFAACVMSATYAQDQSASQDIKEQTIPKERMARTIPNSKQVITLRFSLSDGNYIIAAQKDGGMIRIETAASILGFTPYKLSDGSVAVRVFRIEQIAKAGRLVGERMTEQATYGLADSQADFKSDGFSAMIELLGVQDSQGHVLQGKDFFHPDGGFGGLDDQCCVTCNGVRSCACAVQTNCGRCCLDECC